MAGDNKALALGVAGLGGIYLWSAIFNKNVTATIQELIQGKKPQPGPMQEPAVPITQGSTPPPGGGGGGGGAPPPPKGSLQSYAQQLLSQHGWGNQWADFDYLENAEAGWNPTAENPSSGAYGIAQSLGHPFTGGPAPNGINEYGGYGLSPDQSKEASMGDGYIQLVWMMNYIQSVYGSATAAANHERTQGNY